ncbi:MAG: HAMP domain-containing histidine kinase [Gemmataceae bacterium]|nr:HAMP domain-containing histidine kinase [Gemmataceae bacterium]
MKSIRLSLVVYFLVLLGLTLGTASALAYWTTAQTVDSRRAATRKLLCEKYQRKCQREKTKMDDNLLAQATTMARLTQFQFQSTRFRVPTLGPLGLLSAGLNPSGYAVVPLWIAEGVRGPLNYRLYRLSGTEIQFNEDDVPGLDSPGTEYFQISSEWGNVWRSRSMEDHTFPIDPNAFATTKLLDAKFDDVEIKPGVHLRRVVLKAPASRFRYLTGPRTEPRPDFFIRPPSQERVTETATPAILVMCGIDTASFNETLAGFREEHDRELVNLDDESRETMASLRNRLLAIGLATFALTFVGGFGLVRLGLLPLRRLSHAVSQVSEKDFRLPLDGGQMPTELRPIVERLTQTLELLQRAFAREKQAAADISHELRTPLAALLTTTELALRKPRASEEYRELLSDCHTIGQQMSQLVERLLALARLDAGVDTLRPREVDAAVVAEQCAALVRPLAQARNLSLRVHRSGTASLHTDPDKLREVLNNLLHNAIEYNRPNGSVELKVERNNGHLHVEVTDTGIGIAPEARAHIFERFYRVDPSRQATGLHAGLGLSIVKGYIDLMGGHISVESSEGQGSTFRVDLPASHT